MMVVVLQYLDADALALNYDSSACIDDGSCAYSTACTAPTPTGIHAVDTIHNRVRIKYNMSSSHTQII